MNNKDDNYYIKQALVEIDAIIEYTKGATYNDFINDKKTLNNS